MALAPGAQILVYEGNSFADTINRMATDNAAKQLSSSWAYDTYPSTLEQILMEYAAQGQAFFQCSLDHGADLPTANIAAPVGDPYVTVVGGTSLVTTGPGGAWLSETAWNNSSGGFNSRVSDPFLAGRVSMAANMGSTIYRNFPTLPWWATPFYSRSPTGILRRERVAPALRLLSGRHSWRSPTSKPRRIKSPQSDS